MPGDSYVESGEYNCSIILRFSMSFCNAVMSAQPRSRPLAPTDVTKIRGVLCWFIARPAVSMLIVKLNSQSLRCPIPVTAIERSDIMMSEMKAMYIVNSGPRSFRSDATDSTLSQRATVKGGGIKLLQFIPEKANK